MGKQSSSQAKNTIKRSLFELISKSPTEKQKQQIWTYFGNKCAYCGIKLIREERKGHLDHIVPSADGGGNGMYNKLLACSKCNGDEKKDTDWETFLATKAKTKKIYNERYKRIKKWKENDNEIINKKTQEVFDTVIQRINQEYDSCVKVINSIKR